MICVIVGMGPTLCADLAAWRRISRARCRICCINESGFWQAGLWQAGYRQVDYWYSYHAAALSQWAGLAPGCRLLSCKTGAAEAYGVEVYPLQPVETSGGSVVQAARLLLGPLGLAGVVFAGVPLTHGYERYAGGVRALAERYGPRVRGLSGATREICGAPDKAWALRMRQLAQQQAAQRQGD